ncbi:2,5-diamino-6-ribosylamino-4(3H)-pyrimidinone 5'-phosphate reductase [Lachnellula suecica]|uniref:2,5-diamino-6-ribosylamino-4(3H)-pyrimidinone 5'-phosphate reductase n=1 Tax=Lachnellula suecica TaxID=602035 RepID=A0A8T9C0K1_9HELO|nr:2,5-diamino-6-ribosylamino-4(3H)-pyrimidinone 5'-phosphate reductase [Lachnellula suecica]
MPAESIVGDTSQFLHFDEGPDTFSMTLPTRGSLHFPAEHRSFLEPHLPPSDLSPADGSSFPFTTITYASSLDSQLALSPGAPTQLSGPQSKAMTHYLRSRHDAILIGVGTAIADNPSLNCRIEGVGGYGVKGLEGQPRPIVVDPAGRWDFTAGHKIFQLARSGQGRAPYIITSSKAPAADKTAILREAGGKFITVDAQTTGANGQKLDWKDILKALSAEGLRSVMIEGGGAVINSLLQPEYFPVISSMIVTIAPTWLGVGGVVVSPPRRFEHEGKPMAAVRLEHVKWHPFGDDVVLCGKVKV